MALSNGSYSSGPLIFLNPRSKNKDGDKVNPHFEIARVNEDKKIAPTGETATKVTGDLLRPKFTEREYKGVINKHVGLYIKDGDETYSLDLTYRISTRSLFNAILSLTDPKGIEISIYESKKGYEALSLRQNDDLVAWKFDGRKGEIPEAITVKFKGKDQHDFTPVDDFFEENLKAWAEEVFGPEKASKSEAKEAREQTATEAAPASTPTKSTQKTVAKTTAKTPTKSTPVEANDPDSAEVPF